MNRSSVLRLAVTFLTAQPVMGFACAGLSDGDAVHFGDQTNIIIWDAANKTEHFVRKAAFISNARNLGFIAPTPSKPELSDVADRAFDLLREMTPDDRVTLGTTGGIPAAGSLEVVQEQDVGAFHAATVLGGNAQELAAWMKKNGYVSTPSIQEWTKKYIAMRWYLTAFKIRNASDAVKTGAVRMSFRTDKPFNPFYVPADNVGSGKSTLTLYLVSKEDLLGRIGDKQSWIDPEWKAALSEQNRSALAELLKLPGTAIPRSARVQEFKDHQFPRMNAEDIFFSPAPLMEGWQTTIATAVLLLALLLFAKRLRVRRLQAA